MQLKEQIARSIKQLGEGLVEPVAYDTAWVARVPQLNDLSKPAFPEALQWLREHQLPDGGWGSDKPVNAHGNTLSTLIAVIALAQWEYEIDKIKIERGLQALKYLAPLLAVEPHETVGFELLLPTLINECSVFNLSLPKEALLYYHRYEKASNEKRQLIALYQQKQGIDKPATWWFSLEMLGNTLATSPQALNINEYMLSENGSIFTSTSATAYALTAMRFRGQDLPNAYKYLQKLVIKYKGGIPHFYPTEEFENTFSIDFFLKAGMSAKAPMLSSAIQRLSHHFNKYNGVAPSEYFPLIDADGTSVAIHALYLAGYPVTFEPLLPFFNGICMSTYIGERTSSISVNIAALKALQLFKGIPTVDDIIFKITKWITQEATKESAMGGIFDDKWHFSPHYSVSRAVFALHGLDNKLAKRCIDWLLQHQHTDGGWGWHGDSTAEETAFASLALSFWLRQGYELSSLVLTKALAFLSRPDMNNPKNALWISKVLYCIPLMAEIEVLSARYALQKTLLLQFASQHLHTLNFNLGEIGAKQTANRLQLAGKFIYFFARSPNALAGLANQHNTQWAIRHNLWDLQAPILKVNFSSNYAYAFYKESLDDLAIVADFSLLIVTINNLLDAQTETLTVKDLQQAFVTFLEIMAGKHTLNSLPPINFPKFAAICKASHDIRQRLMVKEVALSPLLESLNEFFEHLIQGFNGYFDGPLLLLKEYISKRGVLIGAPLIYETGLNLREIILDKPILLNKFYQAFKTTAFQAMAIANDVLSLTTGLEQGEVKTNYVFLKQQENNLSLQQAYDASIHDYNQCMLKLTLLEQKLMEDPLTQHHKALHESILLLKDIMYGNLKWSLETKRYQTQNVFVEPIANAANIVELNQMLNEELEEIILAFSYYTPSCHASNDQKTPANYYNQFGLLKAPQQKVQYPIDENDENECKILAKL